MKLLTLYCKSFSKDLRRIRRLAESISKHNRDNLDFIISVPNNEIKKFSDKLKDLQVTILTDEEIIKKNAAIDLKLFNKLPGNIAQQIVKSEFWRINPSNVYLCLDSDSIFIRDFHQSDYVTSEGYPFTVLTEAHDLLNEAIIHGKSEIIENFKREAASLQNLFEREGRQYSFGPMPMAWHNAVWQSLDRNYLKPRNINFMDAIIAHPLESRWYGEALLKYQAIPLLPCEPFFKVYHYAWQLDKDRRQGLKNEQLSQLYSGVIYQSSWERNMDWPREEGNLLSLLSRRFRRALGKM